MTFYERLFSSFTDAQLRDVEQMLRSRWHRWAHDTGSLDLNRWRAEHTGIRRAMDAYSFETRVMRRPAQ